MRRSAQRLAPLLSGLLLALLLGGCGRAPLLGETSVSAVDPARGAPGDEITITGTGFYRDDGGALRATVCGRPLLDLELDGERRVVTIPPAGRIDVIVGTTLRGRLADDAVPGPSEVAVTLPRGERVALADAFVCEDDAPTIERFESGSATAATGSSVRFGWTVATPGGPAALRCSFDPGDGSTPRTLEPCSSEGALEHVYAAAGTYRAHLVVDAGGATTAADVGVTIGAPPSISAFSAAPELIAAGESAELSWRVAGDGDVALELTPAPGDVSGLERAAVTPTATTTYTLRARSPFGASEARATVTVRTPPAATDDGPLVFATGASATAAGSLLDNDDLGGPAAALASFGGGDLGGGVADADAGSSVPLAGGTLTVGADGRVALDAPTTVGSYTFDYRLTNSAGSSDATVTLTVRAAPAASDDGPYAVPAGGDLTVAAADPNALLANDALGTPAATLVSFGGGDLGGNVGDTAAGSSVALAGGTLTVGADGSFRLEGPTARGEASFGYRIENAAGSSDATVTLTVRAAPAARDDTLVAVVGSDLADDLTVDNGSGADDLGFPAATLASFGGGDLGGAVGDAAPGSSVPLAGGTLTVAADGSVTLAGATATGSYAFDYRLTNSAGSSDATVTLTVQSGPGAGDDGPYTVLAGDDLVVDAADPDDLLDNDALGNPAATLVSFGGGDLGGSVTDTAAGASVAFAGGTLTVNADGSFRLDAPTARGEASFDYRVENLNGSSDATVTVRVRSAPTAADDALTATVGSALNADLTADNGGGADDLGEPAATVATFGGGDLGGSVTDNAAGASVALAGGTLTVNANGSATLTGASTAGSYTFDYRLSNAAGSSDATVALTVQSGPTATDDLTGATSAPGAALHAAFGAALDDGDGYGSLLGNDSLGLPAAAIVRVADVRTNDGAGALANVAAGPFPLAGGSVTVTPLPGYPGGSLVVNADGTFAVTPPGGYTGLLEFDYVLENPLGNDSATVRVAFGARPAAVADTYAPTVVGNVAIDTSRSSGFSLLANDAGDALAAELVGATDGDATVAAGGTFTFVSAPGHQGAAAIEYRVGNGFGASASTASVALTVADTVWFVDAGAAPGGDGRQGSPFADLTGTGSFVAVAGGGSAGDVVHLASGGYTAGVTLPNDQIWIGEGSSVGFAAATGLTLPADSVAPATGGSAPQLSTGSGDALTLGEGVTLRGFDVAATGGYALADAGATVGTLTIREVDVTGTGGALRLAGGGTLDAAFGTLSASGASASPLRLDGVGGSLSATGGTLAHAGSDALVAIDGGSVAVTYPGALTMNGSGQLLSAIGSPSGALTFGGTLTANAGSGVAITGASSGVTFNGNVSLTGTNGGVTLTGVTGSVTWSSNGSSIAPASGSAFVVSGGSPTVSYPGTITHDGAGAAAATAVRVETTSGGSVTFGGRVAVGSGTPNGADAVVLANATGAVSFSDLDIVSGTGAALVASNSRLGVTAGDVSCSGADAGGYCLDLSNVTSDGITLTSFAADRGGAAGGGVRVLNGSGPVTLPVVTGVAASGASAVLVDGLGALSFGTASAGPLSASGASALDLRRAALDVRATTLASSGSSGYAVRVADAANARVTITGAVTITNPGGRAVLLTDLTGGATDVSVADGSTVQVTGRSGTAVQLERVAGAVDFGSVTVGSSGDAGYGALLTDASATIAFDAFSVSGVAVNISETLPSSDDYFPTAVGDGDGLHARDLSGSLAVGGGTISSAGDDGVDLRNVASATLTGLTVTTTGTQGTPRGGRGIEAQGGSGLTLSGVSLSACGNGPDEACLGALDLGGTLTILNSSLLQTSGEDAVSLIQTSGSLVVDVDGSTFGDTDSSSANGGDGFELIARNGANVTLDVAGSTFRNYRALGLDVDVTGIAVVDTRVTSSAFTDLTDGGAIAFDASGNGVLTFDVAGNSSLYGNGGSGDAVRVLARDDSRVEGFVRNNSDLRLGASSFGSAVTGSARDRATLVLEVSGNTVTVGANAFTGIYVASGGSGGETATLDATVANNTVTTGGFALGDIALDANSGTTLCADLTGNAASANSGVGLDAFSRSGATVRIEGYATSLTATWGARSNTPAGAVFDDLAAPPSAATCATPTLP